MPNLEENLDVVEKGFSSRVKLKEYQSTSKILPKFLVAYFLTKLTQILFVSILKNVTI